LTTKRGIQPESTYAKVFLLLGCGSGPMFPEATGPKLTALSQIVLTMLMALTCPSRSTDSSKLDIISQNIQPKEYRSVSFFPSILNEGICSVRALQT